MNDLEDENKLMRLTKTEMLKLIQEQKAENQKLIKEKEETANLVSVDMSFKESPEERDLRNEKQIRKDFIKRMTRGRWVSEDKYQEHLKQQQRVGS